MYTKTKAILKKKNIPLGGKCACKGYKSENFAYVRSVCVYEDFMLNSFIQSCSISIVSNV